MRKNKYLSEPHLKECHTCRKIYESPELHFFKDRSQQYGLCKICKYCDSARTLIKRRQKAYYNIPINCIECNKPFFASRGMLNAGKKRNDNSGRYCSRECAPPSGMVGKSWNGKRRGINNPAVKFDESFVRKIKELIAQGIRNKDIAKEYGVPSSYVSALKHNRLWSHL